MSVALPPPQLLEIDGPDAVAFAHAQFSSDVRALQVGTWQWSAWLSAQGRVRSLFRLLRSAPDRLLLVADGTPGAALPEALQRFVLRAKVRMRVVPCTTAAGYASAAEVTEDFTTVPEGDAFVDAADATILPIQGGEATRWYGFGNRTPALPDRSDDATNRWRLADIRDGLVRLSDGQSERFLPHWLALDRLGAVSVGKGCYPGQEIVARLHFKGGNKRWLHEIAFEASTLPVAGTILHSGTEDAPGELLAAAWTQPPRGLALAILPRLAADTALQGATQADATFRVVCEVGGAAD